MEFYVYQYVSESGLPYYIGKGSGRRIHTPHTKTILPPVDRRIIIQGGLTNEDAKKLEGELINKYGRKVDGGILDNIKINQWACHTGWKHSDETKSKISKGNKGKKRTEDQLKNYKGTTSKEVADKIAKTLAGRTRPASVKQKISKSLTGRKLSPETIAKRTESFNKTINQRQANEAKDPLLATARKEKNRKAALGENNGNYGKKLRPETIAKRQEAYRKTINARTANKLKVRNNGN
jgi:hypothetical protein